MPTRTRTVEPADGAVGFADLESNPPIDLSGRHLVVGLPCYTGMVPQALMNALIRTTSALRRHGVTLTISARTGSGIVDKVRDELIHSFLERTEGTDLLFLDDDILFEPDDVLRMMAWGSTRDMVVGPYCTKEENPNFLYGLYADEKGKIVQDDDGLVRVVTAPAGFMLMRRSMLEKMRERYPELQYRPKRGEFSGETITALCMMFLEENPDGTRSRIGEDIALCKRWTALGGEIWLDPVIDLGHVGRKTYRKPYVEWLQRRAAAEVATRECKRGTFSWMAKDTGVGLSMREYGEWAEAELQTLLPLISVGDVAIDVGANIGTHTIPLARKGFVYAFEPQGKIFDLLNRNVEANNLSDRVARFCAGCSDADCDVELADVDYNREVNFGALSIDKMRASGGRTVHLYTLDSFMDRIEGRVKLIKIDVEGMEASVLRGAARMIKCNRPVLFVENNTAERAGEVIDAIGKVAPAYALYWHVAPYFNPSNWKTNDVNAFQSIRPEFNILAVHPDMIGKVSPTDPALIPFTEDLPDWKRAHRAWLEAAA